MHQIKDIFSLYTIKILFRIKILLKSDFGVLKVSSPLHLDNQANLLQLEHSSHQKTTLNPFEGG